MRAIIMIVGESVVLNIMTVADSDKDDFGLSFTDPNSVLNHSGQLILYTIKWSIFSHISSYDTTMEQLSVIKQLMELYIIQDDEFHYGSVMLELGVALHGLGDKDLEEEK